IPASTPAIPTAALPRPPKNPRRETLVASLSAASQSLPNMVALLHVGGGNGTIRPVPLRRGRRGLLGFLRGVAGAGQHIADMLAVVDDPPGRDHAPLVDQEGEWGGEHFI